MDYMKQHMSKLGLRVKDRVTGFTGVVTSISFDLYGCIQAVVNPGLGQDGKPQESTWFDMNRLAVLDTEPVMQLPNFDFGRQAEGNSGPAEKPASGKA